MTHPTESLPAKSDFLQQAIEAVESHLADDGFGVEELCYILSISRSQLHRKLHDAIGMPTTHFIRQIRLIHAKELLEKGDDTVAEIAYRIGFGSPSYFNTCFHEYYGYPPGEIRKTKNHKEHKPNEEEAFLEELIKTPVEQRWITSSLGENAPKRYKRIIWGSVMILIVLGISTILWLNLGPSIFNKDSTYKTQTTDTLDKSIAVLPFRNDSQIEGTEYFANGVMEAILNNLSKIHDLKVISRTSVEQYRGTSKTASQIASELGVAYFLEGSAQQDEYRVRINVQLIDARTDQHIWSENYDRQLSDIFTTQSEIAQKIANELQAVLTSSEIIQIQKSSTSNMDAYQLYVKGRYLWSQRTEQDLQKSIEYFNEALSMDPGFAEAYAGLADAYFIEVWWGRMSMEEGHPKAKQFALKAIEIDPTLSEAHATLGAIACWFEWEWDIAEQELKQAINLNPNYATAYQYYAELCEILRRSDEARDLIEEAKELDPLSIGLHNVSANLYHGAQEYDKALAERQKASDLNKNWPSHHWKRLSIFIELAMGDQALEELKMWLVKSDFPSQYIEVAEEIYANKGPEDMFRWAIDQLNNPFLIADAYKVLGEYDLAMEWSDKACLTNPYRCPNLNNKNKHFNIMVRYPRYRALLKEMGLL